eukprot:scaffold1503_cov120-Isochrysis_galbana.AAC.10
MDGGLGQVAGGKHLKRGREGGGGAASGRTLPSTTTHMARDSSGTPADHSPLGREATTKFLTDLFLAGRVATGTRARDVWNLGERRCSCATALATLAEAGATRGDLDRALRPGALRAATLAEGAPPLARVPPPGARKVFR